MAVIAPAILSETIDDYTQMVQKYEPFAERVQIDISDGEFAPTSTVGVGQLFWPVSWTVDVHAMVARPSQYVQALAELKPHTVIFHAEVEEDLLPTLQQLKQLGIRAGVALLRPTVPKDVMPLIEQADHVMIFTGELGKYGGTASLMQLEKVRLIRTIQPNVEVGWDGGANADNVFSLAQGGVDVINVGGALSGVDDPEEMYKKLVSETTRQSVI